MNQRKSNPTIWFEIYVDDMQRAKKFYEEVLQIQLTQLSDPTDHQMQMLAFPGDMEKYGSPGTLVKMEGAKAGGSNVIIYFGSDDCAEEESRAEAAGGKVCKPKMSLGEFGFCSILTDTEGNTIGIHSMK